MVFNKLRKGEKRSLTSLHGGSPRTSMDAQQDVYSPATSSGGTFAGTTVPLAGGVGGEQAQPTMIPYGGGGRSLPMGDSRANAPMDEQELLHIKLRDEVARRAEASRHGSPSSKTSSLGSPGAQAAPNVGQQSSSAYGGGRRSSLDSSTTRAPRDDGRNEKYESLYRAAGVNDFNDGVGQHPNNSHAPVLPPIEVDSPNQPFMTPIAEVATPGLGYVAASSKELGGSTVPTASGHDESLSGSGRRGSLPVALPVVSGAPLRSAIPMTGQSKSSQGAAIVPLKTETTRSQTQGPANQVSSTSQPQVLSTETHRYIDTPMPTISFPKAALSALTGLGGNQKASSAASALAQQPKNGGILGNVAQDIPPYMFVEYTAKVCQECVDSENRMHMISNRGHSGHEAGKPWRYMYKDPEEHQPLPSEDPNTRKTGRKEYEDSVSLASPLGKDNQGNYTLSSSNGPACQCAECLKNRELVRHAAENGLIEKIFNGVVHPLSERIVTTTTTQIIRAPIIEETVVTVRCEEPNCPECLKLDQEYKASQLRDLMTDKFNGMVIHETGDSGSYKNYKNLWNLNDGASAIRGVDGEGIAAAGTDQAALGSGDRLKNLLSRAGNPRQEHLRGREASMNGRELSESELVNFDSSQVGRGEADDSVVGNENCGICGPNGSILAHRGMQDFVSAIH